MTSDVDDRPTWHHNLGVAFPPLLLSSVTTLACYLVGGSGLLLYLGGIALAMTLAPPLVLAHGNRIKQFLAAASIVDGVGIVWLMATFRSETTIAQWLSAYVLVAACVVAMMGLAAALSRLLRHDVLASAAAVVLALGWLAWPIWLSAWVGRPGVERLIGWLVPVHPLLAINGLLSHLGVWGEQRLMYGLTRLGQDVPYQFPSTIAPAALAHAMLGASLLFLFGSAPVARNRIR